MGCGIMCSKQVENKVKPISQQNLREQSNQDKNYGIDVIEVSNIALAIKNKEHTINVQLTLRCENLPIMKTFGSIASMVVIYKHNDNGEGQQKKMTEIGMTEIVRGQLNPKYIKSFILSFNEEKKEEIQFKIYDIVSQSEDLHQQFLVGKAMVKLDTLVDQQNYDIEIGSFNNRKNKTLLRVNCVQYDGGNSKHQIGVQLSNLSSKGQYFYIIQVLKLNEWIPIAKSQIIQIRKNFSARFKVIEVPFSKFQGSDNSLIKFKIYELTKNKQQQQIGCTDEITLINIYTDDDKIHIQRVYRGGLAAGQLTIYKCKNVTRDSFISYIVNGAPLHLILAIDFSNSNQGDSSLHNITIKPNGQQTNPYIWAIEQIVGVLQYFNYYNGLPLYGFGAKLPPYYQTLGNCFALNGNYFNPTVTGGTEEIIKIYKQNLKKVKKHGPTKISEIIDLAIEYAQQHPLSLNYYALVILTDGQINDFNDAVDCIVRASKLPISIVLVGVGSKDFSLFNDLDSDASLLKSSRTEEVCSRDIVDFIRVQDFNKDQGSTTIARQTFAEIPYQFIEYMNQNNLKPNKQKKNLKALKAQFISNKIKETKKGSKDLQQEIPLPKFLQTKKKNMIRDLIKLGFNPNDILLQNLCISVNDLNYFIEVHSQMKSITTQEKKIQHLSISIKQTRQLQEYLQQKDQQNKKKTLQKLEKIQSNQFGRKAKNIKKQAQIKQKIIQKLQHPCLNCYSKQINILHLQCCHASVCQDCATYRCILCNFLNKELICLQFT